jgi:hypothetical protein
MGSEPISENVVYITHKSTLDTGKISKVTWVTSVNNFVTFQSDKW